MRRKLPNPAIGEIKFLKQNLAELSLMVIGQHTWSDRIQFPNSNMPTCFCKLCDKARKAYRLATNTMPTQEQEENAVREWGQTR